MKVTLHEVAARADVSIATVSRALNGLPVSKDSLARVLAAANDLGYVANEAARALRSDRTLTMGALFFDLSNTLGIDLLDALSEAIEAQGYALLISTARGDAGRYDLLMHRFLERRIDAVFCIRPDGEGASLERYSAAGIPVLTLFAAAGPFAALPSVRPRFDAGADALAAHLAGQGHRRALLVRAGAQPRILDVIARALEARGMGVVEVSAEADMAEVVAQVSAGATAAIAQEAQARRLIAAFEVPAALSVVSLSDSGADSRRRNQTVSTSMIDPQRTGRAAGEAMLRWLGGDPPVGEVAVDVAVFEPRGTTGPAPA